MNRGSITHLLIAAAFPLILCFPLKGWAQLCCFTSDSECIGESVGSTGKTCPNGTACVQVKDQCPSPSLPGTVECECRKPKAQLSASPKSLDISVNLSAHTAKSKSFKVSNAGNVPVDFSADQLAGPCVLLGPPSLPSEVWVGDTWRIRVGGSKTFSEKCQPPGAGLFTDQTLITNLTTMQPGPTIDVTGSAIGNFDFSQNLPPIKFARKAFDVELSYNHSSGAVGAFYSKSSPSSSSSSDIIFKKSIDGGLTWGKSKIIVSNGGQNGSPLAAPVGLGWRILFNEEKSGVVEGLLFTPGKPIPTPTSLGSGTVESMTAHDDILYMGMSTGSFCFSGQAKFAGSLNGGRTWRMYDNVPINSTNVTCNANMAVGPSGSLYALWSDTGTGALFAPQFRFASVSLDGGVTWSPPVQMDSFVSTSTTSVSGHYFNPTAFVFNNTLADFVTQIVASSPTNIVATTAVDLWNGGSDAPRHQQIGPNGLQGGFGIVINDSFLYANAIDSKAVLNVFTGPLGGTLTGGKTSVKGVQEDRVFPININKYGIIKGSKVHALTEIVTGQEPGPAFDIIETVK